MFIRVLSILCLSLAFIPGTKAQDKISLTGYVSDMQTVYHVPDQWLWENSLHNRLNLQFYPTNWLSGTVQLRNRFITGNTIRKIPGYGAGVGADMGLIDMTWATDGNMGDSAG